MLLKASQAGLCWPSTSRGEAWARLLGAAPPPPFVLPQCGEVSGMSVGQRPPTAQLVRGIEARAHLQAQLFVVGRMGPSPRERSKHGGLKRPSTGPVPCRARSPRAGQRRGGVSDPAAAGTWGRTRLAAQAARWVCFQIKTHTEHTEHTEQRFTPRTKKQTPGNRERDARVPHKPLLKRNWQTKNNCLHEALEFWCFKKSCRIVILLQPAGLPAPDLCYFSPCLTQAPCASALGLLSRIATGLHGNRKARGNYRSPALGALRAPLTLKFRRAPRLSVGTAIAEHSSLPPPRLWVLISQLLVIRNKATGTELLQRACLWFVWEEGLSKHLSFQFSW